MKTPGQGCGVGAPRSVGRALQAALIRKVEPRVNAGADRQWLIDFAIPTEDKKVRSDRKAIRQRI